MKKITDMSLTLGQWGGASLRANKFVVYTKLLIEQLSVNGYGLRLEAYGEQGDEMCSIAELVKLGKAFPALDVVMRLEPRTDRFEYAAAAGIKEVVFELPVSEKRALSKFPADGVDGALRFAAHHAEIAAINGLIPELSLLDPFNADVVDILMLIDKVNLVTKPRRIEPKWRLVDDAACFGNDNLAAMKAFKELFKQLIDSKQVSPESLSVQVSNRTGYGKDVSEYFYNQGVGITTSSGGFGHLGGWTDTFTFLENISEAFESQLLKLLDSDGMKKTRLTGTGMTSILIPAETSPEDIRSRTELIFGDEIENISLDLVEPMLTALSGKAGLLHLIHRNNQDKRIDTDDPRVDRLYDWIQSQWKNGRMMPMSWIEIRPFAAELRLSG